MSSEHAAPTPNVSHETVGSVGSYYSLESARDHSLDGFPTYVRAAFHNRARAGRALRLYRKRGWNPAAVLVSYRRAVQDLNAALDRFEHEEMNPPLF